MDDANVDLPNILSESECVLNNINITESDVVDLLNILDISKAIGPEGISPRILKEGGSILKYPLYKIFNISLRSGVFPSDWKKASVCPVLKKDSPALLQNYRPISLIRIVGKVMERCVFKHINHYLLNVLDISKAIGPDGISPRIVKEGASILKYPLCKIFNISLRSGVFPSDWKKANVCPVFKKDSPTFVTKLSSDIDD